MKLMKMKSWSAKLRVKQGDMVRSSLVRSGDTKVLAETTGYKKRQSSDELSTATSVKVERQPEILEDT